MHKDINLGVERRIYQKRKRREKKSNDPIEGSLDKFGTDLNFDEIKVVDKSLKVKVFGNKLV